MILMIDNYDSFTYNLVHYLIEVGAEVKVIRNDECRVDELSLSDYDGIVLSPGPCSPNEAGICLELIAAAKTICPILGVCLGHQAIGQAFGADIVRGDKPMHAVVSAMSHNGSELFTKIPSPFNATRYHSLIIKEDTLPETLNVTARSEDGVIQAVQHQRYPIYGVQFHPESIASEHGHQLMANFLEICKQDSEK